MPGPLEKTEIEETTRTELLTLLEDHRRIVLGLGDGRREEIELRKSDGTYYCDTSVRVHTYEDPAEMNACLEQLGVPGTARCDSVPA